MLYIPSQKLQRQRRLKLYPRCHGVSNIKNWWWTRWTSIWMKACRPQMDQGKILSCYLGALGVQHPSLSWCCQGYQPDSGMWRSLAAGRGWPAASQMAALQVGSRCQRSEVGPPGFSASGWWASGHPKPRSVTGQCRQGTRKQTRWEQPPSEDLEGDRKGRSLYRKKMAPCLL